MTPTDWLSWRRHHDQLAQAEIIAMPTTPISRHLRLIAERYDMDQHEVDDLNYAADWIEREVAAERKTAMVKKIGIPVGSYAEIKDAAGKVKLKPKRKKRSTPQEIASRKRRKWKAAK